MSAGELVDGARPPGSPERPPLAVNARRWFGAVLVTVGLLAVGGALRPLHTRLTESRGTVGGLRAVAADATWLHGNLAWERRDAVATDRLVRLTTALDPRPLEFWVNGARAFGYDFAEWEIAADGGATKFNPGDARAIRERHAANALAWLAAARTAHPTSPALEIEAAQLRLVVRRDVAAAAEHFRRAAELPGAPYHAARIHAELLVELGREREALAWLRTVHAKLPADDPAALREAVARRIAELEAQLRRRGG